MAVTANRKVANAYTASVANGANITLLNTAATTRFVLHGLVVTASAAGRYQVYDAGGSNPLIYDGLLAAGVPLVLYFGEEGYVAANLGANITFANASGDAADLSGTVIYTERFA